MDPPSYILRLKIFESRQKWLENGPQPIKKRKITKKVKDAAKKLKLFSLKVSKFENMPLKIWLLWKQQDPQSFKVGEGLKSTTSLPLHNGLSKAEDSRTIITAEISNHLPTQETRYVYLDNCKTPHCEIHK